MGKICQCSPGNHNIGDSQLSCDRQLHWASSSGKQQTRGSASPVNCNNMQSTAIASWALCTVRGSLHGLMTPKSHPAPSLLLHPDEETKAHRGRVTSPARTAWATCITHARPTASALITEACRRAPQPHSQDGSDGQVRDLPGFPLVAQRRPAQLWSERSPGRRTATHQHSCLRISQDEGVRGYESTGCKVSDMTVTNTHTHKQL